LPALTQNAVASAQAFLRLLRQLYPKSLGKDFSFDGIADGEPSSGSVILSAPPKRPLIHRLDLHFSDTSALRSCSCLGTAPHSYSVGRSNLASKASASRSEALVLLSHGVLAVHPFETANGEMAARYLPEMLDEGVVHSRPADCADDRNGLRRELLRDHRPEARRDLRDEANQQRALFASMPRTTKYPLSDGFAAPGPLPKANTCTHASAVSGSDMSSPSLRAMSAIDLNMTMVEIGSSIGRVARPKAPPAAPEAVANALCKIREAARGWRRIVRSAACSATSSAVVVAVAIACEAGAGRALPMSSIGLPASMVSRAARLGCSSDCAARRSSFRSSWVISDKVNSEGPMFLLANQDGRCFSVHSKNV